MKKQSAKSLTALVGKLNAEFVRFNKNPSKVGVGGFNKLLNEIKARGNDVKFDHTAGQYFLKFAEDGTEQFLIEINAVMPYHALVKAPSAEIAKKVAFAAMEDGKIDQDETEYTVDVIGG